MSALRSIAKHEEPYSAKAAFLAADYDSVIMLLDADRTADGDALLSRAYIRLGHYDDALRVLDSSPIGNTATGLALRAETSICRGQYGEADTILSKTPATSATADETDYLRYVRALLAYCKLDTDTCASLLEEPIPSAQQKADELRAYVLVRHMKYRDAVGYFEKAATGADQHIRYSSLAAASFIAREMYLPDTMQRIEALASVDPPRHLAKFQCHIMRASAWFLAIEGNFEETLRRLRRAARYATSIPWKIALLVDRGHCSLAFGNSANGWDDLDEAVEMAREYDWLKSHGEERRVLLTLAALLADHSTTDAQWCLNQYFALKPTDGLSEWSRDIRSKAFEFYSRACLARAHGNTQEAHNLFGQSFSIFHKAGYEWRSALTLVNRLNSIYSTSAVPEYVTGVLRRYPKSWFRALIEAQLHTEMEPVEFSNLTTMQRKVLALLAEGKTNRQIADALGRKEQTIADHVTEILRKTNCSSRKELIRQCAVVRPA